MMFIVPLCPDSPEAGGMQSNLTLPSQFNLLSKKRRFMMVLALMSFLTIINSNNRLVWFHLTKKLFSYFYLCSFEK